MYRKILAPMDGSTRSECTLEHVKEIAKGCGVSKIVFLAVVDIARSSWAAMDNSGLVIENPSIFEKLLEAEKEHARYYLSKLTAEAKQDGLDVESVVLDGVPEDTIIDYANNNGVDLIVMSSHGRSGVSRFALGSVTDKIVRSVAIPVMIIPPADCRVKI